MEISQLYEIFTQHPIITTDSRVCPTNSIFFALRGANFNGNEYAIKALEQGCSYAVVDDDAIINQSSKLILVDDVLKTLQDLSHYHRKKLKIPIVAITGTNGKTTTKELITCVLSQSFKVASTEGNLNNHIGVPLTLLKMTKQHEIGVVEMGANHVGEIKTLVEMVEPNFGLITNVGHAHLEGFGSFENIIKTKGELYDYIRTSHDGKIFIDASNHYLNEIAEGLTLIHYGIENDLFVSGKVIENNPFLKIEWYFSRQAHTVQTQLIGEYNLSNLLASIAIGKYFGVKTDLICKALEEYTPTNNRSQLKKTNQNSLIVDAYNANPSSMSAAINNFSQMEIDNKVLILGDMRELGLDSLAEHQKIIDQIQLNGFEEVLLVGENFSKTKTTYKCFKDLADLRKFTLENPFVNKFILIKGSRGMQLEKCVDFL